MTDLAPPVVDIAFDCVPLRSVGRLDIPLDASESFRRRAEQMQLAIQTYGAERTYFLYNARCLFRFANSEVEGVCRFEFEGIARTDAGDRTCEDVALHVTLVSETCGGVPAPVQEWLALQVHRAVTIEFNRFIAAGQLASRSDELGEIGDLANISGLAGLDV